MVGGGSAGGGVCDRGTGDSASEAFRCHGARIVDAPACWCGAFSTAQAVATCTVYRASCCSLHGWRHPEGRTDLPSAYSWECPVAPFGVLLLLLFRLGGALGLLPNRGDRLLVCGFLPLFFLVLLTLFLCLSPRGYRGTALVCVCGSYAWRVGCHGSDLSGRVCQDSPSGVARACWSARTTAFGRCSSATVFVSRCLRSFATPAREIPRPWLRDACVCASWAPQGALTVRSQRGASPFGRIEWGMRRRGQHRHTRLAMRCVRARCAAGLPIPPAWWRPPPLAPYDGGGGIRPTVPQGAAVALPWHTPLRLTALCAAAAPARHLWPTPAAPPPACRRGRSSGGSG